MALPHIASWAVAGVLVIAAIDAGSTGLATLQAPEDVRTVGQVAAAAAADKPVNRSTAFAAWEAALTQAEKRDITLDPRTFVLEPDGQITLTGTKVAPTLVAGRIGALTHLTTIRSTMTVKALTFR